MDLTAIRGLGPARRTKLEQAGVGTVEALAEAKLDKVARASGISSTILSGFQRQAREIGGLGQLRGIGEEGLGALVEADVRSLHALASADLSELEDATGLARDELRRWKLEAVPLSAASRAVEVVHEVEATAREAARLVGREIKNARVVLREGLADAKVRIGDDVVHEVKILPLRAKDNVEKVLENIRGNVVVLREKADTALVRLEDELYDGLPIFKEKMAELGGKAASEAREVRVRVQEIRDRRVMPEAERVKSRLGRIFKRGDDQR